MTTTPSGKPFPWRLRLFHEGFAGIRAEWAGRTFRFDPFESVEEDDQVVLTWHQPEHSDVLIEALKSGSRVRVLADGALHPWLQDAGSPQLTAPGGYVDKEVLVEAMPYTPRQINENLAKASAALMNPSQAARHFLNRSRQPESEPQVIQLTFPDGGRLLHLGCSLHRSTDAEWLRRAQEHFGGADWIVVGMEPGEEAAVSEMITAFEGKFVHITDLVNEKRAQLGLPVNILTLPVDALRDAGVEAFPFVSGAGYRYE